MADSNIVRLPKQTLVKMIENAVGTKVFNSLFVEYKDSGEIKDVCNDCEYSCAFFVSGLLTLTGFIPRPHATVKSLRKTLQEALFKTISSLEESRPGDIVFWEKIVFENGLENEHVGFLLSKDRAVSTSYKKHCVVEHSPLIPGGVDNKERKITLLLRAPDQQKI